MTKTINRICMMVVCILAMAFMCKGFVSAKEVTVQGQDIQAALNEAANTNEQVIVTIPAGTYAFNSSLLVYSNTTIKADGAIITVNGGQPALTHSEFIKPTDIVVSGGTWVAEGTEKVINFFMPGSNITLDNMTVCGDRNSIGIHLQSVEGGKVSNCKVDGVRIGINLYYCKKINVSGNEIKNSAETGFCATQVGSLEVSENTILQNGKYGILVDWDSSSVIKKNTLNGCAIDPSYAGHGEGLVVRNADGTWIQENKVFNVESHEKDWGNGILIGASKNITVQSNTVENAGNHGLQATYSSQNVQFNDNIVNRSGNIGISISKDSTADIKGCTITNTTGSAIVYDGKVYNGKTGVSGTVNGCTIDGSTSAGIHIELANVTVKNTVVKNSTEMGVVVLNGSVTLSNSVIRQDKVDMAASGIVLNNGGKAELNGNRICNFGNHGIVQNKGCTITGSNNQVMVDAARYSGNAINLEDIARADKIRNNTLLVKSISGTEVTCQNYWSDFVSGAVVNGLKYETKSGDGGYFTASYPQTDSSRVVTYVMDEAGNAIILQAPADFDLNKLSSGDVQLIEGFVKRMYRTTLNREAAADEVSYYVDRLQSGLIDGSAVAQNFILSDEFKGRNLSVEDYVTALYTTFFDRAPASVEVKYWKDELDSGMSRKFVLKGFVNSNEFLELCQKAGITRGFMELEPGEEYEVNHEKLEAFVERLYVCALKRVNKPSEEEKQYYVTGIVDRTMTAEAIAKNFFFSSEFQQQGTSDEEYLGRLYVTFMDRQPAAFEIDYWITQIKSGLNRETVLTQFAASNEFKKIMASYGIR